MYIFLGFLLHLLLLPTFSISQEQPKTSPAVDQPTVPESKALGVIELTSATLDASIRDGSIWLIEFYAPWCRHCTTFAPTYAKLAYHIHAQNADKKPTERTIKVAKINGDKEQASSSRFNILGYPSFFLVDGWQVYQYDGPRTEDDLLKFVVREGYKNQHPLPIWSSPMGPLGQVQAFVFYLGSLFFGVYNYLVQTHGYSPAMAAFIFAFGGMITGLVTMIAVAIMLSAKVKED